MKISCKTVGKADITLYQSASGLPDSWDLLLPDGHPMRKHSLMLYENMGLADISFFYALSGDPARPKALAYFQLLSIKPYHLNANLLSGWQARTIPPLIRLFHPTLLVAGHLFRHDIPTFYSVPECTDFESYRYYQEMIDAVAAQSCAKASLVKDVPRGLVHYFQNFSGKFAQLRNDISMEMCLPDEWKDFTDYEKSLKHKYAQKLRKVRASVKHLQIEELDESAVYAQSSDLFALYSQVCRNQTFSMGMVNEQFLPDLKRAYKDRLKIWGLYEQGKMVAFASAWVHDAVFDMFYIGFDYGRNAELNLYFNILYLSIEKAIAFRKAHVVLGRTALEAKARLGCKPRYLHTFLSVRSKVLRDLVFAKINTQHIQEGAWEERHPFKA
ncbi:peptidogalycan biosysnthesis protein [Rurimicrobium arvi]|uniref:GNAT family N-acetyltransferase n=1 Tax=Rurimicrobium arvi TaxID=2049916 RepID=A0ABP8MKR1_9BACT